MPVTTRNSENQTKIGFRTRKSRRSVPAKITDVENLKQAECRSENRANARSGRREKSLCSSVSVQLIDISQNVEIKDRFSPLGIQQKESVAVQPKGPISPRKRLFREDECLNKENSPLPKGNKAATNLCSPSKQKKCELRTVSQSAENRKESKCKLALSKQDGKQYGMIRQKLHTSLPDKMLCREGEMNAICNFMEKKLQGKSSGSLYVSGAPGTGKTVSLTKALNTMREKKMVFKEVWINCMSLNQSTNVYQKIATEVSCDAGKVKCRESEKFLEKFFQKSGSKIVLILDEIDQLESKNQEILYKLFEWPSLPNSRLVLVGIANALDLTDRILPRLQSRTSCRPELLQFPPYNKDQIIEILHERLKDVNDGLVDKNTIQFCARKVSAVAGDMRKALDIMRRSVELVEIESRKQQVLKAVTNSPTKISTAKSPVQQKVTLSHVAKVVSEVYGSGFSSSTSSKESLPLQQKVLICTLLLLLKNGKCKEVTLPKLHSTYSLICQKRQLSSVVQEEFVSLCELADARGIISLKRGKNMTATKVSLRLQEADVDHALQDKTLLSSVLEGGLPY